MISPKDGQYMGVGVYVNGEFIGHRNITVCGSMDGKKYVALGGGSFEVIINESGVNGDIYIGEGFRDGVTNEKVQ